MAVLVANKSRRKGHCCLSLLSSLLTFGSGIVFAYSAIIFSNPALLPDVEADVDVEPPPLKQKPSRYVPRSKIGEHEIIFVSLIASLFREGNVIPPGSVLDAGAQLGEQAAYYAKLAPDRTVHAADPSPSNVAKIKKSCKELPNVNIHLVGMGPHTKVRVPPQNSSLLTNSMEQNATEYEVETLDSLFFDKGEPLGFARLDVGGMELQVIEGGINTLTTYQPIVSTELRVHGNATYTTSLLTLLDQLGYDTYVVDEVSGNLYMDYRNLLNIPRKLSRNLPFSDAFNLALATDAIFRVNASSIATLVYPCCAVGGECCETPQECCTDILVNQWLEEHHMHRPVAMLDFKEAKRATTMRWRNLRMRYHATELGTR
jgi:FkbM family methyltransferase